MVLVLAEIACAVSVAWHASNFWDIAVFLTDDPTRDDRYRLTDLGTDVLVETGEVVQPLALPLRREREDSYLMQAIRADGITL